MRYWIDRSGSEFQNIIVVTENAIILGSSSEDSHDKIEMQLKQNVNPIEVMGSDDLLTIPFTQIQNLVSRNTDPDIEVKYKAKRDIEDVTLDFEDTKSSDEFLQAIEGLLPENFNKKEIQQSAITAAFAPLLSLLLGSVIVYLYFNKYRMLALIGGGIWIIGSIYMLLTRFSNPPKVTHWGRKGGYVKKTWKGIKATVSALIAAAFVFFHSHTTIDSHGEKALFEQVIYNEISSEEVSKYLERGSNINFIDEDGETALSYALYYSDSELASKLINAGADVNMTFYGDSNVLDVIMDSDIDTDLMKLILDKYEARDKDSLSVYVEAAKNNERIELAELIQSYIK